MKIGNVYNVYPIKMEKNDRTEMFETQMNSYLM